MADRRVWSIQAGSGKYLAVRREDLRPDEVPMQPQNAWKLLERIFHNPSRLHELTNLREAVSSTGVRSDSVLRMTELQRAVLNGDLVLLMLPSRLNAHKSGEVERLADQVMKAQEVKTWVEFEVVDMLGHPVPGRKYLCALPDGTVNEGKLDSNGRVRFDGIIPGNCSFVLTELDIDAWERVI